MIKKKKKKKGIDRGETRKEKKKNDFSINRYCYDILIPCRASISSQILATRVTIRKVYLFLVNNYAYEIITYAKIVGFAYQAIARECFFFFFFFVNTYSSYTFLILLLFFVSFCFFFSFLNNSMHSHTVCSMYVCMIACMYVIFTNNGVIGVTMYPV